MCTGIIAFLALFMTSFPVTSTAQSIPEKVKIDSIVVWKSKRVMVAYSGNKLIKSYDIALGKNPVGKKEFEGDFKTPEGLYYIDAKSARSKYHKNLNISYPSKDDKEHAKKCGKKCGGEIKIHGLPNRFNEKEYLRTDWTWGCIAVTNSEIEELYEHTALGSPILLLP